MKLMYQAITLLLIFYLNSLLCDEQNLISELATIYAPMVYVHEQEKYFPYSVSEYLRNVNLKDASGAIKLSVGNISPKTLAPFYQNNDFYLEPVDTKIYTGFQPAGKMISAPIYVNVVELPDQKRFIIQYWFFYALSGPFDVYDPTLVKALAEYGAKSSDWSYIIDSSFVNALLSSIKIPNTPLASILKEKIRNKSIHQADWEHINVYIQQIDAPTNISATTINHATYQIEKVFYAHHRSAKHGLMAPTSEVSFYGKTHPVVFSALMTHASYPNQFNGLNWLLDKTGFGYEWHTWSNIEFITQNTLNEQNAWINFTGKCGKDNAPRTPSQQATWINGPTRILKKIMVNYGPLLGEKSRASENFSLSIPTRFNILKVRIIPDGLNIAFGINKYFSTKKDINIIDQLRTGSIIDRKSLTYTEDIYISRIKKDPKQPTVKSFEIVFEGIE